MKKSLLMTIAMLTSTSAFAEISVETFCNPKDKSQSIVMNLEAKQTATLATFDSASVLGQIIASISAPDSQTPNQAIQAVQADDKGVSIEQFKIKIPELGVDGTNVVTGKSGAKYLIVFSDPYKVTTLTTSCN